MIFPLHCRMVGVAEKYLRKNCQPESQIYFSSRYVIVFEAEDRCEVYEVDSEGEGFIHALKGYRRIADASRTLVYGRPVDITNRPHLIRKAVELCNDGIDTVVFRGVDRHYTFVHQPAVSELIEVDVFDVIPPSPPWLAYNVERLDEAGMFGELGLIFNYRICDLKQYEDPQRTTIFPCRASGLEGLFLDSLDEVPAGDVKLVGCNTSRAVLEARYPGLKYEHVNICPLSTLTPARPFIVRCCQSDKLGIKVINGIKGAVVHWGSNPREIYDAVRTLAAELKKE